MGNSFNDPMITFSVVRDAHNVLPVLVLQKIGLAFARPTMFPFARFTISGTELIPSDGPVILVGNHRSYFDAMAIAMAVAKTGRTVRFLGKKEVFDAPIIGQVAAALGGRVWPARH